jgi:uncharacterized membrane protein
MALLESAIEQAKQLVEKVTGPAVAEPAVHAVTIGRPRHAVLAMLRNPETLSQVFGEIADVQAVGPNRLRWTFHDEKTSDASWESVITADDHRVRYAGTDADSATEIVVDLRDAPQDKGTEVIARVSAPAPGLLTGPLTFKALYRARALLQTGEIPTLTRNPSARNSPR